MKIWILPNRIFNFGLANENSDLVNFFVPTFTGSGGGGLLNLHPEEGPSKGSQVAIKILDDLEKEIRSQVDFIKVDIEGYKYHAFKGAEKLLLAENAPDILFEFVHMIILE